MTGEICLRYKNNSVSKKIKLKARKLSSLGMIKGLMFSSGKRAESLLFDFPYYRRWRIHSFFVFFSFFAVYMDENNNISEIKKVKPFKISVSPQKKFKKLLEVPFFSEDFKKIKGLVDK